MHKSAQAFGLYVFDPQRNQGRAQATACKTLQLENMAKSIRGDKEKQQEPPSPPKNKYAEEAPDESQTTPSGCEQKPRCVIDKAARKTKRLQKLIKRNQMHSKKHPNEPTPFRGRKEQGGCMRSSRGLVPFSAAFQIDQQINLSFPYFILLHVLRNDNNTSFILSP